MVFVPRAFAYRSRMNFAMTSSSPLVSQGDERGPALFRGERRVVVERDEEPVRRSRVWREVKLAQWVMTGEGLRDDHLDPLRSRKVRRMWLPPRARTRFKLQRWSVQCDDETGQTATRFLSNHLEFLPISRPREIVGRWTSPSVTNSCAPSA